jgi:ABC-type multidrug transport system permease subunit
VAEYGPPESNRKEGLALTLFAGGLATWVAALAYASPILQVILVIVGVAMNIESIVLFRQAKVEGDAARKAAS